MLEKGTAYSYRENKLVMDCRMPEMGTAYSMAARLLPEPLQGAAMALPPEIRARAEEFRLRRGRAPTVLLPEGEQALLTAAVEEETLRAVLETATEHSAYRYRESIRRGFVTVQGGCRVGLCGTAVMKEGEIATVQEISSLSIRIAREVRGAAAGLYETLCGGAGFESTLLIAPPGGGKTTLLRDLIRCLSDGDGERPPLRVCVVDERGEIAAIFRGAPQFDIGRQTDVLTGTGKAEGILMLLRAMRPQVIAVDEITAPEDIRAMVMAANCGVSFLATVHAKDWEDLRRRRLCRELLEEELFHRFVILEGKNGARRWRVEQC
jgi:stage III sporulation protein AA